MVEYTISENCLHINDSYKIESESEMVSTLSKIHESVIEKGEPDRIFYVRTTQSMVEEWQVHNLFYDLGLFISHTKDVDINDINKFWQFLYKIFSIFYLK